MKRTSRRLLGGGGGTGMFSASGSLLPAEEDGDLEPQEHVSAAFVKDVELRQHFADVVPADRIAPSPAVGQQPFCVGNKRFL